MRCLILSLHVLPCSCCKRYRLLVSKWQHSGLCFHDFNWGLLTNRTSKGAGIAQCVGCPTETPHTIQMQVWVPSAARDFLPCSASIADLLTASPQPCCAVACNLCAHEKSPTLAAIPLLGHMKILHTLIEIGSTALVPALPYPSKPY